MVTVRISSNTVGFWLMITMALIAFQQIHMEFRFFVMVILLLPCSLRNFGRGEGILSEKTIEEEV